MEWLSRIEQILAVMGAIMAVASLIVNLTPTPKDDRVVGFIYRLIEVLSGIVSETAKELPGERDDPDAAAERVRMRAKRKAAPANTDEHADPRGIWGDDT
jgi:hypothetical protein